MHFVHVEDFIHPDAGYQVNLLSRLQVAQGHQVTIVTSELDKIPEWITAFFGKDDIEKKDQKFYERTGAKIIRVPIIGFYSGRSIYYPKLFKVVDGLKPDVLFVHGEDTMMGMQFIWRYPKKNYPMVLDCHMLEMASMNKFREYFRWFYRKFVTPIILKYNIPLIRVVDSDFVQKCLGIPLQKTVLLSFGTDTDYFKPNAANKKAFRTKYNISEDDFVILYAGKLDIYKGGQFLANTLKKELKAANGRKIVFVIVGNASEEYGKKVEETFAESENKIIRLPTQPYYDLGVIYQSADLAVYPKQCSMSFFEAQSCGLPVLFEINEINVERASHANGFTFKSEDIEDFRSKMLYCAEMDEEAYKKIGNNARQFILESYNYVPIAQQFTDVMINEYNRYHGVKQEAV